MRCSPQIVTSETDLNVRLKKTIPLIKYEVPVGHIRAQNFVCT